MFYVDIVIFYLHYSILAEALMILENLIQMVTEGEHAAVNVCVAIVSRNIECPISFPFELRFSTEDVEAGKFKQLLIFSYH